MRLILAALGLVLALASPASARDREQVIRDRNGYVAGRVITDQRGNKTIRDREGFTRQRLERTHDGYIMRDRAGYRIGTVKGDGE